MSSTEIETEIDTAQVTAINATTRIVTLRTTDNQTIDVQVGEAVKNFPQIKVGDNVVATLERSLTFTVSLKGTKVPTMMVVDEAGKAKPGAKPAAAVARSASLSGVIVAVDVAAKTVSVVESRGGTVHVLQVKNPARHAYLPKVHPGVVLTVPYTTTLGLSVEPAK